MTDFANMGAALAAKANYVAQMARWKYKPSGLRVWKNPIS